jgi:hypothetical protein
MGSLAWVLAVSPDSSDAEHKEAVELAKHADRLVPHDPNLLDILATALAAAGQFEDSISIAQEAAALSRAGSDRAMVDRVERRLELFKRHVPYVER